MQTWKEGDSQRVDDYLDERALRRSDLFHRLVQSLIELSPRGSEERSLLESLSNHIGDELNDLLNTAARAGLDVAFTLEVRVGSEDKHPDVETLAKLQDILSKVNPSAQFEIEYGRRQIRAKDILALRKPGRLAKRSFQLPGSARAIERALLPAVS
jgi:hypothetical protein